MIISTDIKPDRSLYVIGADTIKILSSEVMGVVDAHLLYEKLLQQSKTIISFSYFLYALDWLFVINKIDINDHGEIIRCF